MQKKQIDKLCFFIEKNQLLKADFKLFATKLIKILVCT